MVKALVVLAAAVACLLAGYVAYPALNARGHPLGGCVRNAITRRTDCSSDALRRPTVPTGEDCNINDVEHFAGAALCSWYLRPLR